MHFKKPELAESSSDSLQEEKYELQQQFDQLQEDKVVDQHMDKERHDIAIQTDTVRSCMYMCYTVTWAQVTCLKYVSFFN